MSRQTKSETTASCNIMTFYKNMPERDIYTGEPEPSRRERQLIKPSPVIEFAKSLPEEKQLLVWGEVKRQLFRLRYHTNFGQWIKALTPDVQIDFIQSPSFYEKNRLCHQYEIPSDNHYFHRVRKEAEEVLVYVIDKKKITDGDGLTPIFDPEFRSSDKYVLLQGLENKSELVKKVLKKRTISKMLVNLPHFRNLLEVYQQDASVEHFLKLSGLNFTYGYVALHSKYVSDYLFSNQKSSLEHLLTRCLLSRWVTHNTNWIMESPGDVSVRIAKGIELAYSSCPESQKYFAKNLRAFFSCLLEQDYITKRDSPGQDSNTLYDFFVSRNGRVDSFADIDVEATYRRNAEHLFIFNSLYLFAKTFVQMENKHEAYRAIAKTLGVNYKYSDPTRRLWIWTGKIFLENVLLMRHLDEVTWPVISTPRSPLLRDVRIAIHEALKKK